MLIGVDDVEPGVGEEATDRGDQPRPVGTGKEQARCRFLDDRSIIAPAAPGCIKFSALQAEDLRCLLSSRW